MIAANEAVAGLLESRKVPTLYRIHERPEPARVERLVAQLAALDVPTPPLPELMSPQQAGDLVGEISRLVDEHVRRTGRGRAALTSLVLRSLKQARYSPENMGHHGLHSPRYCHFTSPIRRYPDLVCHRALLSAVGGGEQAPRASELETAGDWCSDRERDAAAIERAADDVARCFLLERELFERGWDREWPGEVIGVIGAGAFVAFGEGHEGLLPVRRLRGDWWELDELETMLVGAESGKAIRLGDPVDGAGRARRRPARSRRPRPRRVVRRRCPTSPATARPATATTCSTAGRRGMVLTGTEVKSLRDGKAQIKDGYASVRNGEVWLLQRPHPALRPGDAREPRARAPAQAAAAQARDRAADRQDAREGADARADADLLQGPARQGRDRAGAAARTSATSGARSRSASSSARWSARSARAAERSQSTRLN